MAITRKPKPYTSSSAMVDIDALINKGGSVAATTPAPAPNLDRPAAVMLRIPAKILERVDQLVEARPVKVPRHTWLMEAIIEKLMRDETESL